VIQFFIVANPSLTPLHLLHSSPASVAITVWILYDLYANLQVDGRSCPCPRPEWM